MNPQSLLDGLARRFEEEAQPHVPHPEYPVAWGQFLDVAKQYRQTGPYGTAAGVLVLWAAGRGGTLVQQGTQLLEHMWREARPDHHAQLPRAAITSLALRLTGSGVAADVEAEIERRRLAPGHLWGNYWLRTDRGDGTPRVFPSALALLSVGLFRTTGVPATFLDSTAALERHVHGTALSELDAASALAALLSIPGYTPEKRTIASLTKRIQATRRDFGKRPAVYFFDFEFEKYGRTTFARDYVIGYPELFLAIASLQDGAPGTLRIRGEHILDWVGKALARAEGCLKPPLAQRVASLDQLWVALALRLSQAATAAPRSARLWHSLTKERPDNLWTGKVWPIAVMSGAAALNAFVKEYGLLAGFVGSALNIAAGAAYIERVKRRRRDV